MVVKYTFVVGTMRNSEMKGTVFNYVKCKYSAHQKNKRDDGGRKSKRQITNLITPDDSGEKVEMTVWTAF